MRRVVITGIGMVSPLASGAEASWQRLLAGQNAARRVENFEVDDLACQVACQIPRGDGSDGTFNADDWMEPKDQRKVDDFIVYSMAAATQALADADWVQGSAGFKALKKHRCCLPTRGRGESARSLFQVG